MLSKIKGLFRDIRAFNKKYKCLPLIIFAVIYITSPIGLLLRFLSEHWLFYIDDIAVLIITCVITYMEVFSNEGHNKNHEDVEGVYTAVRRNSVGSDGGRITERVGDSGGNAVHGVPVNQFIEAAAPEPYAELGTSDERSQPSSSTAESAEPAASGYYERNIIEPASNTDDCIRQVTEQSRPESFIIPDGTTIIW
jgi:uncharacterized membrane protein YkvA (DUF1232 family)